MGMKKESKKKSRKEKWEEEPAIAVDDAGDTNNIIEEEEKPKKKKKSKKEKSSKKRGRDQVDVDDVSEDDADGDSAPSTTNATDEKNKPSKEERKAARAAKKSAKSASKSALLEQIPKLDSDGIPFNKIQIRRMLRRVKHGLDPIATEEEEREIRQREKREKVEEEALYAADADQNEEEEEEDRKEESNGDKDGMNKEDGNDGEQQQQREDDEEEEPPKKKKKNHNPPSKGTKRAKPVPPGYICMACKNAPPTDTSDFTQIDLFTPHWIYDCPMKKTKRGCNQVAKKLRGLHDPPSQKVFVSGLPFECDEGSVKRYFEDSLQQSSKESGTSVELVHCKLLKFEDSKRCKGTAFLTFDSDDAAKLALKMNGSVWREVEEPGTKTKSSGKKKGGGKKMDEGGEKKELKLRVSKVLNRHVTKQKRGGKR